MDLRQEGLSIMERRFMIDNELCPSPMIDNDGSETGRNGGYDE